jgi:MFS transporter, putative metabolite transport protein
VVERRETATEPVAGLRELLGHAHRARVVFMCIFWSCQVVPTFAIFTYTPVLLEAFGVTDPNLGAALMSLWFIVGVLPAILLVDSIGRRPLLIIPFAIQAMVLAALPFVPPTRHWIFFGCFTAVGLS